MDCSMPCFPVHHQLPELMCIEWWCHSTISSSVIPFSSCLQSLPAGKECSNYHIIAFILHARKVILKILQARLQQYMNRELPDVQAGFRKGRGTRDHAVNIRWIKEKAREFQRNIYFCFIDYGNIVKAVYCHPAYLTYMQSITCKMSGWMKHKLESRLQE